VNSALYASDDIVCSIRNQNLTAYSLKSYISEIGCADISNYSNEATKIEPLYTAYATSSDTLKTPVSNNTLYLSSLKTQDGAEGYKSASIAFGYLGAPVGGFEGLFYQEPGKDWQYLIGTQDALNCKDFNTVALQKSFSGQTCYDATTLKESVVKA